MRLFRSSKNKMPQQLSQVPGISNVSSSPNQDPPKALITMPKRKATLNAFRCALDVLEKSSVLGIPVVAKALARIFDNMQEMAQAEEGWQMLASRLERLTFVLDSISKTMDQHPKMKDRCERYQVELEKWVTSCLFPRCL